MKILDTSEMVFTFWDLLAVNLSRNPNATALREQGRDVSYSALGAQAERISAALEQFGIKRGDRVGIHLPKSVAEVAALFAAARIGCVFVNINAGLAPTQIKHIIDDCEVSAMISDSRRMARLEKQGILADIKCKLQVDDGEPLPDLHAITKLPRANGVVPNPSIDQDLAALIYTSGSTGQPKGVMLTHQNIIAGARSVAMYLDNQPTDRLLSVLPFSFDYGLNQLTTIFLVGGVLVLQPAPMPSEIAKSIRKEKITGVGLVPTLWVDLIEYLTLAPEQFETLRYVTNTGGKIPDATLLGMESHLGDADIVLMYGLTESFRSTWLPPALLPYKRGAIGVAVPNAEVFVVDPEKGLCGPNEPGELLHRGAFVSRGYWRRADLTEQKIRQSPHLSHIIGNEKVVCSGDIVKRDADGVLWFIGRQDKLIKTSGYRVSPTEVEEAILAHADVCEVKAFGVPDDRLGQRIEVVVRPVFPQSFDPPSLRRWCSKHMANYLVPARVHVSKVPFPRNSNGKVDEKLLLESYVGV